MKKLYIQPDTQSQPMCSVSSICVGSAKGEYSPSYGGADPGEGAM